MSCILLFSLHGTRKFFSHLADFITRNGHHDVRQKSIRVETSCLAEEALKLTLETLLYTAFKGFQVVHETLWVI